MSGIVFETFGGANHGSVSVQPLRDRVMATVVVQNGVAGFEARAQVRSVAHAHGAVRGAEARARVSATDRVLNGVGALEARDFVYSTSLVIEPTVNIVFGVENLDGVSAHGFMTTHGAASGGERKDWASAADHVINGVFALEKPSTVASITLPDYVGGVLCFMTPGYLVMQGLEVALSMPIETGTVQDSAAASLTIHIKDRAAATSQLGTHLVGTSSASERVVALDRADPIFWLVAAASAVADDSPAAYLDMLLVAADVALATGAVETQLDAFLAVAVVAEVHDSASPITFLTADATMAALDEAAMSRIGLLVAALSSAAAADEAASQLSFVFVAVDEAGADDSVGSSLEALAAAIDAGHVVGVVRIGNTSYATYAMTLAGGLVSEYDGVDINSQATHDGRMYASSSQGIFLMEGDDDAGAPIAASVQKGISNFGTPLKKAVPAVYIGYRSTGRMALKVTTTDDRNGERRSSYYALNNVRKNTVSDNRFTPGKGKHAVYWDFEILNQDGADFDLDVLKPWIMALNRRK